MGVTVEGTRDVLGLWAGEHGDGEGNTGFGVLSELKNRGVHDVCIVMCDASRKDWSQLAKDLKPVYTAPSEQAALDRFAEFGDRREKRYPAIIRLWTNA